MGHGPAGGHAPRHFLWSCRWACPEVRPAVLQAGRNRDPSPGLAGRTCTGRHPHCPDQPGPRQGLSPGLAPGSRVTPVLAGQGVCPPPPAQSCGEVCGSPQHATALLLLRPMHQRPVHGAGSLVGAAPPRAAREAGPANDAAGKPWSRVQGRARLGPCSSLPGPRTRASLPAHPGGPWLPVAPVEPRPGLVQWRVCLEPQLHKGASLGWAAGCGVKGSRHSPPRRAPAPLKPR